MIISILLTVIMRWNGTDITGIPTLIYHDELLFSNGPITDPFGPGRLICEIQEDTPVTWEFVDGSTVPDSPNNMESSRKDRTEFLASLGYQELVISSAASILMQLASGGAVQEEKVFMWEYTEEVSS